MGHSLRKCAAQEDMRVQIYRARRWLGERGVWLTHTWTAEAHHDAGAGLDHLEEILLGLLAFVVVVVVVVV